MGVVLQLLLNKRPSSIHLKTKEKHRIIIIEKKSNWLEEENFI